MGLNCLITGYIGEMPVLKDPTGCAGDCYVVFKLYKIKFNCEDKAEFQWYKVLCFGEQARLCYKQFKRNNLCCIEGTLDRRESDGKETIIAVIAKHLSVIQYTI